MGPQLLENSAGRHLSYIVPMYPTRLLQRSQALLKLLERSAFIGVWSVAPDLENMLWSEQLALIHGRDAGFSPPPGEAFSFYAPEWRDRVRSLLAQCAQEGTPIDAEVQIVKQDGARYWMRLIGHAVLDPDGSISGIEGALQEIAPHGHAHGTLLRHTVSMGGAMGSGEAFATVDREGRFSYLNEKAGMLLSTAGEDLLGRKIWTLFQKTVRLKLEELFRDAFARSVTVEFEEPDVWQSRWLEVRGYPFGGGLAVHFRDVTARRKSQQHLRLLESSISRLNDIVIITEAGPFSEPGPRIVFVNEAFERRTGYARAEVLGRTPRMLQGPATQRAALDQIRSALEQWQSVRVDVINYNKGGDPFWVDLDISPVWDKARELTHWVAVGRDVTERKMADRKIKYLAFYDQLTKLPNRQLLMDRLEEAQSDTEHPREGALMFIDLDNFKVLNDTLGHQKGDALLQQVAARLRSCVARHDTVARLGGDEFVILLQDRAEKPLSPQTGARIVADRILAVLGEPYVLPGYLHHSTCSIGVALFDKSTPWTVSELLKHADLAMYQAKSLGRNTACFFDPKMQAVVSAGAALASDLRDAYREGQFVLNYQPQVDGDENMAGVEALLRWNHPVRGMVMPEEFIRTAEDTSLIIPIGRWVLETACAQLAAWSNHEDRKHLSIAVNVSVRQFRHPDFVDEVTRAINKAAIAPHKLKLELTESLLAEGIEITVAKMGTLKDMGVTLSLDDFGMGYSSLSYLKRLPLDQLKIDREFVKDVLTDPNDAAIAKTIIGLAHSLHLDVIAEGVETQAQRDYLRKLGCGAYQGYLFSKPLAIEELESFIDQLADKGRVVKPVKF